LYLKKRFPSTDHESSDPFNDSDEGKELHNGEIVELNDPLTESEVDSEFPGDEGEEEEEVKEEETRCQLSGLPADKKIPPSLKRVQRQNLKQIVWTGLFAGSFFLFLEDRNRLPASKRVPPELIIFQSQQIATGIGVGIVVLISALFVAFLIFI